MYAACHSVFLFALLGLIDPVHPIPTYQEGASLIRRDDGLPPELQPILQDDGLPPGRPEEAIQDYDFTFSLEELKTCPDFDLDQGSEEEENADALGKRAVREGTTKVLRAISSNGKTYRKAFLAFAEKKFVSIRSQGPRSKQKPVGIFETGDVLKRVPYKEPWGQWQADHTCDLGILPSLVKVDTPLAIKEAAWTTVQDTVLGVKKEGDKDAKPTENTLVLGRILNNPRNIRGMTYAMNAIRNFIMLWVYEKETVRPQWYRNHRRSNVWGVLREMINTQKQFEDTLSRAVTAIANAVKDDPESKEAIRKYLMDKGLEARKAAIDRLSLDLKDPPPANKADSFFGTEDTSCTTDSPDNPKKDDGDGGGNKADEIGGGGLTSPADNSDPLKCHGVSGDVWMIHRDQAVSAAEQFCRQDIKEKEYFQGSVDQVKLTLTNTDPAKSIPDMPDCVEKFKIIIDSCDGDSPINNPHNYKFGGTYSNSSSGWELKLEPLALKPTENSCDITYLFTENKFEVRGKNFPDGKLGANGEGLKKEIKGCGPLTWWEFKWTPDDVKYQWYASGSLPVGTRSCVGAATQTAGGKDAGRCKGPG